MKLVLGLLLAILPISDRYVNWKTKTLKSGDIVTLVFTGKIQKNWYVYSSKLGVEGPLPTTISWENDSRFEAIGDLEAENTKQKFDEIWQGKVDYMEKTATFSQKVRILKPGAVVAGKLRYQACINDPEDGSCINEEFSFNFRF